jgi:hypothetical protein
MGKAGKRPTYGTKLKNQSNSISELYTLAGIKNAPLSSTMSFGVAGGSSTPPEINTQERLKTSGDTMIGAIAYYPKTALIVSGVIDVQPSDELGDLTDDYTSYLYVTGQGGSDDDLDTISNPSNAGQLLHLEAIASTDITLKHDTGNIFIPSESDHTISAGGFATLIYDVAVHANKWVLVSASDSGSSLLSSVNTWTGVNTFTANSTSITSPNIYLGDESSDTINITGTASHQGDIDMNTWDIYAVDRLKFSQTEGSGDALASTDTGIESIYTSTLPFGMKIQIPTANSAIFQIVRGSTEMLNISALGLMAGDDLSMSSNKITNLATPTSDYDASTKKYVDDNAGGTNDTRYARRESGNSVTISADWTMAGDTTLGNGTSDEVNIKGKVDFTGNTTSATYGYAPYPTGYITIKIAGSSARLYYYAG